MDFSVNPKILKFCILNPIPFFKLNKFLVKISQFKFLVMTEKHFWFINFFAITYFRFQFFYLKTSTPWKRSLSLSQQPTSKWWCPVRSPLCNGACILCFCCIFLFLLAFTTNIFSSTVGFQIIFSCYMTFSCLQKLLLSSYCYFTKRRLKFWF